MASDGTACSTQVCNLGWAKPEPAWPNPAKIEIWAWACLGSG